VVWHGNAAESGMVGWSPLGPADIYVPAYRASLRYVQTVNMQSLRRSADPQSQPDAGAHYTYQHNPGAVTWVHRETMQLARPVGRALQPPPAHWSSMPVTHLAPVAAPPSPIAEPAAAQLSQGGRSTDRPGVSPPHAVAAEPSRPAPR
jgi:hypothetical protein